MLPGWNADRPWRDDLIGPGSGKAVVTIDGRTRTIQRFDRYCTGYRPQMFIVAKNVEDTVHTVTIAVSPGVPDVQPAVERAAKYGRNPDPEKLDGTVLRIGYLMLVGDVVKELAPR